MGTAWKRLLEKPPDENPEAFDFPLLMTWLVGSLIISKIKDVPVIIYHRELPQAPGHHL